MKKQKITLIVGLIIIFCALPLLGYTEVLHLKEIAWSTWWSFGTFAVAVLAAVIAYQEYLSHEGETWQQNRAYIQVGYTFSKGCLHVQIENTGKTVAKNIRISFEPPIHALIGKDKDHTAYDYFKMGLVDRAISQIGPHQRFLYLIGTAEEVVSSDNPNPKITTATAKYCDIRGKEYEDRFTLDIHDWEYSMADYSPLDHLDQLKKLKDIANDYSKIVKSLEQISNKLDNNKSKE